MTSRDQILLDIRTALGRSSGQKPEPLAAPLLRGPRMDRSQYVQTFVQRFEKLAGKAFVVADAAAVVPALAPILDGKRVVASNAPYLETCGITGLPQVTSGFIDRDALRDACAAADIGITSADYALAETGTLVMLASKQEARLVSLLPPVHVAVVPRSRIVANLDELLTLLPKPAEQTSSMVLITGPSRTADIEQILVRGVHGPGEVYVVIVEE
ncbi:MAG TPA: lactate utilization protein [Bryobacteraceae bacterium]|nr:lactate utilization protein [Bryobacteraceae bacterium]